MFNHIIPPQRRRVWLRVNRAIVLLTIFCLASIAGANPNDKQPYASLDVHGQKFAPELLDLAQKLAEQNRVALEKFSALAKENKINKIDPIELSKVHVNQLRLQRAAEQLVLIGEPAGVDYVRRAGLQGSAVLQIVVTLQAIPAAGPGLSRLSGRASEVSQKHAKDLAKIEKLVQRQDWDTAEKELLEVFDDIDAFAVYMKPEDRIGLYSPWNSVNPPIMEAMRAKRKAAALAMFEERAAAAKTDHAKLLADIQAATASVQKTGKHTLAGKELTGPELIAHFDTVWQKTQVAALKSLAIEWARGHQADRALPTPAWIALRSDYEQFATAATPALAALIAADAARVDAASAAALYQAYLPAVADLVDHTGGKSESALQGALDAVLAKSPEATANVSAYRAATDELLRWRERVANEQAKAKQANYQEAHALARAAFMRNVDSAGFYEPEPANGVPKLYEAAAKTLVVGSPKIVGKEVLLTDIAALGGTSQAGIARYRDRIYGRVTLPIAAMATEVAALENQLMVSATQQPLSLAATRAVRGARRGDLVSAGGLVGSVFVEGHVTRFATLPDAAALLLTLGALPGDYRDADQLEQVVLRLDVAPQWAQQRYLFVEVAK